MRVLKNVILVCQEFSLRAQFNMQSRMFIFSSVIFLNNSRDRRSEKRL